MPAGGLENIFFECLNTWREKINKSRNPSQYYTPNESFWGYRKYQSKNVSSSQLNGRKGTNTREKVDGFC